MDLRYPCPQCGRTSRAELAEEAAVLSCAHCSYVGLLPLDWVRDLAVTRCPMCGCPELYRDRRVDRRTGILLFLGGLALAPLTKLVSLAAAAVAGVLLRFGASERLVCYRCGATLRGHRRQAGQRGFDVRVRDRVGIGSPQARRAPPPRSPRC
jgi:DNA-directed RNA polymerase subunit RPC12/RpoP